MDDLKEKRYIETLKRASEKIKELTAKVVELRAEGDIAVVGIGCRFPGGVDSPQAFWELLRNGRDAISEVPSARWPAAAYHSAEKGARGKTYTTMGGFVDDVDAFDASFFGISPREALAMDPQQRLLLEVTHQAIEHAQLDPDRLRGSKAGVFIGMSTRDYLQAHLESGDPGLIDQYSMTGAAFSVAVGRISYFYDLHGPSIAIDTACSSSLVAVHLAVASLRRRETDLALVGGVNLMLTPEPFIGFSQLQALSPDGRCYSFDDRANGYVRGEGCGIIVLKRLTDALADNDRILAVIKGSAVNQDGESSGLTAPNALSQRNVIQAALADFGASPDDIDYIECHGTGTPLGDPIEARALGLVFGKRDRKILIGSAKTNIGHLESAAGIAGLIKVILSFQHGALPASLHFQKPNRHIPFHDLPLQVVTELRPWPSLDKPPMAGISSFGFSGTNAHVIVSGPIAPPASEHQEHAPASLGGMSILPLSAQSPAALKALANEYRAFLTKESIDFANICQAAATGRKHFKHRLAIVAPLREDAAHRLDAFAEGRQSEGLVLSAEHGSSDGNVVFMYPGQGAQYGGMAQTLYRVQPEFAHAMDECAHILAPEGIDLIGLLYGSTRDDEMLRQTRHAQPALFAVEYALTKMLQSWGVRPAAVVGHSVGEYAAACVAGVFSLQESLALTAARGRVLQELPEAGTIAVVFADERRVLEAFDGRNLRVSIAAINAPENVVIAGAERDVADVLARLGSQGIRSKPLHASHAFHSVLVEPALGPFGRFVREAHPKPPQIPLFSTVSAAPLKPEEALSTDYWCRQIREPVRYADAMQALYGRGYRTFLEVGPHAVLTALCRQSPSADDVAVFPSLVRGEDEPHSVLMALGQLYARGIAIDWSSVFRSRRALTVNLPTYAFQRSRFWMDPVRRERLAPTSSPVNESFSAKTPPVESMNSKASSTNDHAITMVASEPLHLQIRSELARMIQEISGISAHEIDPKVNLFRLGLSSIGLTQLRMRIDQHYEIELPMSSFYRETDTLEKLSAHVTANLPDKLRQSMRTPAEPVGPSPTVALEKSSILSAASAADPTVKDIIQQQLQLMARQLDMLQGVGPAKRGESPRIAPSLAMASGSSQPKTTEIIDARASHEKVDLRSMTLMEDVLTSQQLEFVRDFIVKYSYLTHKSKEMMAEHRPVFSDWINSLGFRRSLKEIIYPVVAHRSKGSRLWDLDGREYIDMAIGYGVNYFGNTPDFVTTAVAEQLNAGYHLGPQFDVTADVAERIRALTGVERVTFTNTGTEAVMTALRIARTVTGRDKIVIFANSYHGTFDGILAQNRNGETVPTAPGTTANMVRDVMVLEYGAERSLEIIASCARQLAAVLVEPVQSRNPSLKPRAFLHRLRAITAESRTALIFDEIITGFRVCPGGAQEYFGIRADLVTYGKVLGGGMPIGVVAGSARFLDAIDGGAWQFGDDSFPTKSVTFFGGTFCKHPLAVVAAQAVLKRIAAEGPELQRAVNRRTERFANRINQFFEAERVPLRVRHCASFFRFESCGNYDASIQGITIDLLFYKLLAKGIYTWERRICFFSAAHSDDDVEMIVDAIKTTVAEIRAGGFPFRDTTPAMRPVEPRRLPLTSAQRGVYFVSQLGRGELAYHITVAIRIEGQVRADRTKDALQQLVDRHDLLRAGFFVDADGPFQCLHPWATISLTEQTVEPDDINQTIRRSIEPFDLTKPPLMRAFLLHVSENDHVLVLDAHHLVVDGMSFDILVAEFINAYQGMSLEPVAVQYDAYVAWEQDLSKSDKLAAQRRHWLERFSGDMPKLELPVDFPRSAHQSFRGAIVHGQFDSERTTRLRNLAKDLNTTLFTLLLSIVSILLGRLGGQDDVVVGTAVDQHGRGPFGKAVGMFSRTLALRNRMQGTMSFTQWVAQVKDRFLADIEHQDFPFDTLIDLLGSKRDTSRNPLFDVMFVFEQAERERRQSHDLVFRRQDFDSGTTNFDLTISFVDETDALSWSFLYCSDIFDERTIRAWIGHLGTILDRVLDEPMVPLANINLLVPAERQRVVEIFNRTQTLVPRDSSVVEIIEKQALATPDRIAIVYGDRETTYAALNDDTTRLAQYLAQTRGVAPADVVAVMGHASDRLLVALLAVAKTGAAFVPVDRTTPRERLAFILRDSGAKLLLTERACAESTNAMPCETVIWDELDNEPCEDALLTKIDRRQIFYIIYTSGTTGRPKGVMIHNHGMVNYMTWFAQEFQIQPADSFVLSTSFAFDMAHTSIWVPLSRGATVHVLSAEQVKSSRQFAAYVHQRKISCLKVTPSFFHFLVKSDDGPEAAQFPRLRLVVLGGEKIRSADVVRFLNKNPWACVVDEYGPTEITIACTAKTIDTTNLATYLRRPSIGKPIHNTAIYILDPHGCPVPAGIVGEICVAGAGVAAGYLNHDELNRERFVESSNLSLGRWYRTGDRGRWLTDGSIEFLGRTDDQLKIRGYRIEPSEIEQVLLRDSRVQAAAILVAGENEMNRALIAFLVRRGGSHFDPGAYLRTQLPEHMIPTQFIDLDRMPLTANGKIDKRALHHLFEERDAETPFNVQRNDHPAIESVLLSAFRDVLELAQFDINDDFFVAGGDSIKALRIVAKLRQEGLRLNVQQIFQCPTIATLAPLVSQSIATQDQGLVTGEHPLTAMQTHWLELQGEPRNRYALAALLTAVEPLDANALEMALEHLQLHHDALRTRLVINATGSHAVVNEQTTALEVVNLRGKKDHEATFMAAARRVPKELHLTQGPLFKAILFQMDDEDRLLLVSHHLIMDGVSWRVLLEDLASAHTQALAGQTIRLPAKTMSFKAWAQLVNRAAHDETLRGEMPYWKEYRNAPSALIPLDATSNQYLHAKRRIIRGTLGRESTAILLRNVRSVLGSGVQEVLLVALARVIKNHYGRTSFSVDVESHGRTAPSVEPFLSNGGAIDVSRTVGWFTAIYPVEITLADTNDWHEQVNLVHKTLTRVPHGGFGYGILRHLATPDVRLSSPQRALISMNYLGQFDAASGMGPFRSAREWIDETIDPDVRHDHAMDVEAQILGDCFEWSISYDTTAFAVETISTLAELFEQSLQSAVKYCAERIDRNDAWSPQDWEQIRIHCGLEANDIATIHALAPMQEAMLYTSLLHPDGVAYHEQFAMRLEGTLDPKIFEDCWFALVNRHDALRTVFVHGGVTRPLQVVHRTGILAFEFVDVSAMSIAEKTARWQQLQADDLKRPFNLGRGPLLRVYLQKWGADDFRLAWSCHHIVMDGWSTGILVRELLHLYGARLHGERMELPSAPTYRSYIEWLDRKDWATTRDYWREALAGYEYPVTLPKDSDAGAKLDHRMLQSIVFDLDEVSTRRIEQVAAGYRVTLSTLVMSIWGVLLGRYNGVDDVVFGVVVSGRPPQLLGMESIVGLFLNTVPLRVRSSSCKRFADLASAVQHAMLNSEPHQSYALAEIQSLSPLRGRLFDHVVVFENYPLSQELEKLEEYRRIGFSVRDVHAFEQTDYDFHMEINPGKRLSFKMNYDAHVFGASRISVIRAHIEQLILSINENPDIELATMNEALVDAEARREHEQYMQSIMAVDDVIDGM